MEQSTGDRVARGRAEREARARWTHDRLHELPRLREPERRRTEQDIVVRHLDVVDGIVRRVARGYRDDGDLRQVGCIGLVYAVRRYDSRRGADFLAFAVPTISGEVKRYLRDCGWFVRPPRRVQELSVDAAAAISELAQRLGREPTTVDVASHLRAEPAAVAEAVSVRATFRPVSLDIGGDDEERGGLALMLGEPDQRLERADLRMSLRLALTKLTPRERRIVYLRFIEEHTQCEIADEIGVTQMQVSRLLTAILGRLRHLLDDVAETPPAATATAPARVARQTLIA